MSFFTSADVTLANKVMEVIYIIIGLLCINCGVKNLKDKENSEPVGTFIFWAALGVVIALGRWLPALVSGILVVVMCLPAIFKKVKKGAVSAATKAETEAAYEKIGMKIFAPTLSIGVMAVICAITGLGIGLSALNGVAIGVLVSIILLMIMNKENKPSTFLNDSERMLSTVGPLSMLPMLLACGVRHWHDAVHHDHGQRLRCHHCYDRGHWLSVRSGTRRKPHRYWYAGPDLRLLRHPVHPDGCKL